MSTDTVEPQTGTVDADIAAFTAMLLPGAADGERGEPRWLTDVRLRLLRRVRWLRAWWSWSGHGDESTLAISHSEVDRALVEPGVYREQERRFCAQDPQVQLIDAALAELGPGRGEPWERMAGLLELTAFEADLLALALAAEANPVWRRVYGYLADDVQAADATPGLAAALWAWPPGTGVGSGSGLLRWDLAWSLTPPGGQAGSASCGWQADAALLGYLGGDSARLLDPVAVPGVEGAAAVPSAFASVLYPQAAEQIATHITAMAGSHTEHSSSGRVRAAIEVEIVAPPGSGRSALAAQVAESLALPLASVDAAAVSRDGAAAAAAVRHCRDAVLAGAALLWRNADALSPAVLAHTRGLVDISFLTTASRLPSAVDGRVTRRTVILPQLGRSERIAVWRSAGGRGPVPEPVAEWPLRAAEAAAVAGARPAGSDAARAVAASLLQPPVHDLLDPVPLPYTWDDLVVPARVADHLRELAEQTRERGEVLDGWGFGRLAAMGRGLTALFTGPSGTGKTMAAQVLARGLGRELYRVDLAGVVDKYVGETEKRLRAVFEACERAPVVLFFDEADALFGRRSQVSDAHDRFANIQIDYLLQRMERFDGLAVLATNRRGDLDEAFVRRVQVIVEFVRPAPAERERLWRICLDGAPRVGVLDYAALARELDLTGAGIKAIALAAVFLARADQAPVRMRHIVAAARRELAKEGAVLRPGVLDEAAGEAR